MARKPRTREQRRAEEARRQQRARELGFTSRAQMRTALKQGWEPIRANPDNPRSKIIGRPSGGGLPIPKGLKGLAKIRRECAYWSRLHSRKPTSRFDPYGDWTPTEIRRYHAAYIADDTRANKIENELDSLRDFLVDTMGYYTDDDFDDRYGVTWTRAMMKQHGASVPRHRLGGAA